MSSTKHPLKRTYPLLSIAVLVWAVVITGILLLLYGDIQELKEKRKTSHYLAPSTESRLHETSATDTSSVSGHEKQLRDMYDQ